MKGIDAESYCGESPYCGFNTAPAAKTFTVHGLYCPLQGRQILSQPLRESHYQWVLFVPK